MTEKTTAADAPGAEASMAEVSPEERARIRDNLTALRQQIDSARLRAGRTDPRAAPRRHQNRSAGEDQLRHSGMRSALHRRKPGAGIARQV